MRQWIEITNSANNGAVVNIAGFTVGLESAVNASDISVATEVTLSRTVAGCVNVDYDPVVNGDAIISIQLTGNDPATGQALPAGDANRTIQILASQQSNNPAKQILGGDGSAITMASGVVAASVPNGTFAFNCALVIDTSIGALIASLPYVGTDGGGNNLWQQGSNAISYDTDSSMWQLTYGGNIFEPFGGGASPFGLWSFGDLEYQTLPGPTDASITADAAAAIVAANLAKSNQIPPATPGTVGTVTDTAHMVIAGAVVGQYVTITPAATGTPVTSLITAVAAGNVCTLATAITCVAGDPLTLCNTSTIQSAAKPSDLNITIPVTVNQG